MSRLSVNPAAYCSGKTGFLTAARAWAVIERWRQQSRRRRRARHEDEDPARAYRCPRCGAWHVGRGGKD